VGQYTIAFAVPHSDTHEYTRVIEKFSTYRVGGFYDYYAKIGKRISARPGDLFIADYEPRSLSYRVTVVTARQWLALTEQYRKDYDAEYPDEGPMYVDDCSEWLAHLLVWGEIDTIDIVLTEET
jgi:hypothetical protein